MGGQGWGWEGAGAGVPVQRGWDKVGSLFRGVGTRWGSCSGGLGQGGVPVQGRESGGG